MTSMTGCDYYSKLLLGPLLSFSRLADSFDPESLRLTLKADSDYSDPEFVISDLDLT